MTTAVLDNESEKKNEEKRNNNNSIIKNSWHRHTSSKIYSLLPSDDKDCNNQFQVTIEGKRRKGLKKMLTVIRVNHKQTKRMVLGLKTDRNIA